MLSTALSRASGLMSSISSTRVFSAASGDGADTLATAPIRIDSSSSMSTSSSSYSSVVVSTRSMWSIRSSAGRRIASGSNIIPLALSNSFERPTIPPSASSFSSSLSSSSAVLRIVCFIFRRTSRAVSLGHRDSMETSISSSLTRMIWAGTCGQVVLKTMPWSFMPLVSLLKSTSADNGPKSTSIGMMFGLSASSSMCSALIPFEYASMALWTCAPPTSWTYWLVWPSFAAASWLGTIAMIGCIPG
mmetsp:Transcript_3252/g.6403  ORF Transcript_3252/g.6403 Transcript_3252/m.6403 type:complete len:246 (+) Transcript_3252:1142-1879(+)